MRAGAQTCRYSTEVLVLVLRANRRISTLSPYGTFIIVPTRQIFDTEPVTRKFEDKEEPGSILCILLNAVNGSLISEAADHVEGVAVPKLWSLRPLRLTQCSKTCLLMTKLPLT